MGNGCYPLKQQKALKSVLETGAGETTDTFVPFQTVQLHQVPTGTDPA